MILAVKMVNKKVVGKFFIYLVLKFQGNRPKGLVVIVILIESPKMLVLWNFWTALARFPVLVRIDCELAFGD